MQAQSLPIFFKPELSGILRIVILSLPCIALTKIFLSALTGFKLVKYAILVDEFVRPTIRALFIFLAIVFGLGLNGFVWAWVITSIIAVILSGYFLIKEMGKFEEGKSSIRTKSLFDFSLPMWIGRLLTVNNKKIGLILVGIFLANDQIGIYGAGERIVPLILIPFMAFNAIYAPIISNLYATNNISEIEATYKVGCRWVIMLTLPVFVLIFIFSKEIVLICGQDYADSEKVLLVLLVAEMVNISTGSTSNIIAMTGKTIYNLINSVVTLVLNIVLCLIMIREYGAIGAAYALGISVVVVNLLQLAEIYYLYKIHPFSLQHYKPVFSCALSLIIVLLMKTTLKFIPQYLEVSIIIVVFSISYIIFIVLLGLSNEDRMILKKIQDRINSVLVVFKNKKEGHTV